MRIKIGHFGNYHTNRSDETSSQLNRQYLISINSELRITHLFKFNSNHPFIHGYHP
ncbi:hypothetical protein L208DRAFT_879009 [Tricholoma matsutake]|nr:hypothetical protein L208DRAFT_879009 [Tricholoma matsutake 945]